MQTVKPFVTVCAMAVLDLLALPTDGSEAGFDGMPLAPGVHLRWSFWPELGWPASGFDVQRRYWYMGEFLDMHPQAWVRIASLNLPSTTDGGVIALRRARTVSSGLTTSMHEQEIASLFRMIDLVRPRTPAFVDAVRGTTHVRLPALDALLLSALDPYVARAAGLAHIDGATASSTPADYRVIGHWGTGTCAWNETAVAAATPVALGGGPVEGARCRWWSDRARSLSPATGTPTALQLDGVGPLTLRVQLTAPAREVELELQQPTAAEAATRWRLTGRSGAVILTTTSVPALSIAVSGATLRIVAPVDRLLDEIEIADTLTSFTSWRIAKLRHRRFAGAIGDQMSQIVRVAPLPGAVVPESHVDVPWPPPAVATPAVAAITTEETTSHLDTDGRIRPRMWQIATRLALPAAPPRGQPDLTRPLRLNTGYIRAADASGPARTEFATRPLPRPGNLFTTVGRWRLDGTTALSGPALVARGTVRFETTRTAMAGVLDMQRRTAYLTGTAGGGEVGPGYLEASAVANLDGTGTDLHIQLWVMPLDDPETFPTLVGNDYRQSFWLGLTKLGTTYRPRMWLNGQVFEASGAIPRAAWSHVAVHYDGERIHFFINGALDASRAAALGQVRANPSRKLCIGCDPQASEGPFAYPFCGHLSDLLIRRGADAGFAAHHLIAGWSFDGDLRERRSGAISATIGAPRFLVEHPELPGRRSIQLDGTWCVAAVASPLADPGRRLCIRLRIKPDPGQTTPVILGSRTWRLWLQADPGGYRPTLTIDAMAASSSLVMPAGKWADLIVGVDGDRVVWYVNGLSGGTTTWRFGRIPRDAIGKLMIGADARSTTKLISPLHALIADLEAGDLLPAPAAPVLLIDRATSRRLDDPFPEPTTAPAPPPAADFVVHDLEPGSYRPFATGVDGFGRVGAQVLGGLVALTDTALPPRPGGARARFLPILGAVTSVTPPTGGAPWQIVVAPSRPTAVPAEVIAALPRHDLELARIEPAAAEPLPPAPVPDPPPRQRVVLAETCEIAGAVAAGAGLSIGLHTSPLPRLRPQTGQRVTIGHDRWVRVEWTWTGTQRLLAANVDKFRLSERRRLADGTGWSSWDALGPATVPVVAGDVIEQGDTGASIVPTPVGHADWKALRDRGVVLPEPLRPGESPGERRPPARIWRMVLPGAALPAAGARLLPQTAGPDEFVPGALVAYNLIAEVAAWQLLPVAWHHWTSSGWALYLVENSRGSTAPSTPAPIFTSARYYPGQRYRIDAMLGAPVAFGTGPDGRPVATVALEIAIASIDTAGRASAIDPAPGSPRAAGSADAIAVDRRRPLPPPRPVVAIDRADFHGDARATVTWAADPAASYQLHRATDAAVFVRDTEQRRRRTGLYDGLDPDTIVSDDPDFGAWLAARWPAWVAGWRTGLFVPRPAAGADSTAWDAASAVWRDWATRFYPTLPATSTSPSDPRTIGALAERPGNEDAFALVNPSPIAGGGYRDTINGAVRNRYLYRLRSQSAALVRSLAWGPVSTPAAAPSTRRPRTPVVTGLEPGDRRITVRVIADADPEIAAYRVHRARSRDELADVRWPDPGPGRLNATVPNPLIRVRDGAVALPAGPAIAEVLAIYRSDEWTATEPPPGMRRPWNLLPGDAPVVPSAGVVSGLRPVGDGTPVVVVYRDPDGGVHTLAPHVDGVAFVDAGVEGLTDHFYRVAAIDRTANVSEPSPTLRACALELSPPPPPRVTSVDRHSVPGGELVTLHLEADPGLELMIRRARSGARVWETALSWQATVPAMWSDPITAGERVRYELWSRTRRQRVCVSPAEVTSPEETP